MFLFCYCLLLFIFQFFVVFSFFFFGINVGEMSFTIWQFVCFTICLGKYQVVFRAAPLVSTHTQVRTKGWRRLPFFSSKYMLASYCVHCWSRIDPMLSGRAYLKWFYHWSSLTVHICKYTSAINKWNYCSLWYLFHPIITIYSIWNWRCVVIMLQETLESPTLLYLLVAWKRC